MQQTVGDKLKEALSISHRLDELWNKGPSIALINKIYKKKNASKIIYALHKCADMIEKFYKQMEDEG